MSSRHPHAVTKAVIGRNLPANSEPYDPKETLLDMPAAYSLAKAVLHDPESSPMQQLKASNFMTLLEIKAKEMGVDLNQKGRVRKVRRSVIRQNFKQSVLEVSPLDILLHKSH